ncbi:MAG: VOC family protein [Planctomycetota bacterium]|nr:MAG: VOC family protein [Planctomycetota bacterium]
MRFEHIALNVSDPISMAAWYHTHLGFTRVVAQDSAPFAQFLRADCGMMLELYHNPDAPCPDPAQRSPAELHLALVSKDAQADAERLTRAGATVVEWVHPEDGSAIAMLRDPWGLAWQLCQRAPGWPQRS